MSLTLHWQRWRALAQARQIYVRTVLEAKRSDPEYESCTLIVAALDVNICGSFGETASNMYGLLYCFPKVPAEWSCGVG